MSYEIVYTSSLRGLNGGNRGFCIVAATTGIPRLLLEKLESLSGYRHLHEPGSKRNAVNFCCQTVRIQDEPYFVLSRIADAGTDFSGRGNKIAHHLALSLNEVRTLRFPPTALLADAGFWFSKWSGEPQWMSAGRMPNPVATAKTKCDTWKKTFGDAGWAGIVARSVVGEFEPFSVIVPEGCNTLALVSEVLQLVPPGMHWKVSFSTYFSRTSGAEYRWRFLCEGTEEATAIRNRQVGIVIDSKSRIDGRDEDAYVAAARSGDFAAVLEPSNGHTSAAGESVERRPMTQSQQRRKQAGERARRARLGAKTRPASRVKQNEVSEPEFVPQPGGTRTKLWITTGVLIVSVLSLLAFWLMSR